MGCGLYKLERPAEKKPGNIYSTLKRPQVETKIDVAYEYHFLDFTTLNDADVPGSPAIRLSSVRDLPVQLQELYQQGFILAAVHPLVQPSNGKERIPQEQIFRAVLMKKTERNEKTDNEGYSLALEFVTSSEQPSSKAMIPEVVEKIKGAADQGLKFVGIIHQYSSQVNHNAITNEAPTHNSPEDVKDVGNSSKSLEGYASLGSKKSSNGTNGFTGAAPSETIADQDTELSEELKGEGEVTQQPDLDPGRGENGAQLQQENTSFVADRPEREPQGDIPALCDEVSHQKTDVFAIFNKPKTQGGCSKYLTVHIPMKVYKNGQAINSLEANWLEHMTEHFKRGSSLVNAAFYLGMVNDSSQGSTDGVFIFEEFSEDNRTSRGYDAIVVEQWTVLEGVKVQTDYVPLLNSLAPYGWQLTCILPTPIVKTTREGKLATKQIVFLQRPVLLQKLKKRECKFRWWLSKEERQGKQSKKSSKDKANAKEIQPPEENLIENNKNGEEESIRIEDVGGYMTDLNIHKDGVPHHNQDETLKEENLSCLQQENDKESEERLSPNHHTWNEMEMSEDEKSSTNHSKRRDSPGESCTREKEDEKEVISTTIVGEGGTVAVIQEIEEK
nr:raftlin isoform X2 [Geotrypetes seraphini]XP_033786603.1 raftlin isoform X2 [Geotrypetes seraphini]